jgi:hypothetical protein
MQAILLAEKFRFVTFRPRWSGKEHFFANFILTLPENTTFAADYSPFTSYNSQHEIPC